MMISSEEEVPDPVRNFFAMGGRWLVSCSAFRGRTMIRIYHPSLQNDWIDICIDDGITYKRREDVFVGN